MAQQESVKAYIRGNPVQIPVQKAQATQDHSLNDTISKDGNFTPDAGRYHLYVAHACPWAQRTTIFRNLKGLEDVIGLSVTHPVMQQTRPGKDDHFGWTFANPDDPPFKNQSGLGSFPATGAIPDDVNHAKFIRDLYEKADPEYSGRYTVPVLWDKKSNTVVNHESGDIIRIFNSQFNDVAKNKDADFYPEALREKLDELKTFIDSEVIITIYRGQFADTQEKYEECYIKTYETLDKIEGILEKSRYIAGDQLTEADVRLYTVLIRFDAAFAVLARYNKKRLEDYPNIREYIRELYNMPAFKETTDISHIKYSVFSGRNNPSAIVPLGPDPWWEQKSSRVQ